MPCGGGSLDRLRARRTVLRKVGTRYLTGGGYSGILSLTARECDARHGPGVCRNQQATSLPVYALCAEL